MLRIVTLVMAIFVSSALSVWAAEPSLRGSPSSMARQNRVAHVEDYSFLRTGAQVREFVDKGLLVPIAGNGNYRIAEFVSFPFARPEVRTFLERLSAQHRDACGEVLVITSLTRPQSAQPANAHALSVHPTGMAMDLRISKNASCREWLENTLLSLERQDLLDVTREHTPPHYHVALFPEAYRAHLDRMRADSAKIVGAAAVVAAWEQAEAQALPAQHAPIGTSTERMKESDAGRGSAVSLALLVLAPMGLVLGLRRAPRDHDSADEIS